MSKEQPEALRLAELIDYHAPIDFDGHLAQAAAELRRLHAENEALRAQIGQGVPDGWQPIDTAPKDETSVLLCVAVDADGNPIDWRKDLKTAQVFVQVASWWGEEDGWVVYTDQIYEPRLHFNPTHWMPLPIAPGASAPPAPQAAGLQHEPLACAQVVSMNDVQGVVEWLPHHGKPIKVGESLYSAPQQKPLTDEQIEAIFAAIPVDKYDGVLSVARAIEAAHNIGEKK